MIRNHQFNIKYRRKKNQKNCLTNFSGLTLSRMILKFPEQIDQIKVQQKKNIFEDSIIISTPISFKPQPIIISGQTPQKNLNTVKLKNRLYNKILQQTQTRLKYQKIQMKDDDKHKIRSYHSQMRTKLIQQLQLKVTPKKQSFFHKIQALKNQTNHNCTLSDESGKLFSQEILIRTKGNRGWSWDQKRLAKQQNLNKNYQKNIIDMHIDLPELKKVKKSTLNILNPPGLKKLKSESYIVFDAQTQQVIVSKNSNISLQIASLTKIMTFYTVRSYMNSKNKSLNQKIEISDIIYSVGGTTADLYIGEIYTIQQLLYGLMLPSGNDAALCLADWVGSQMTSDLDSKNRIKYFVEQMNKQAKKLNLLCTKFKNPHGLPHPQAKSTALDVAKLCKVCLDDIQFQKIIATKVYKSTIIQENGSKKQIYWQNTNKLLRRPKFEGIKTGITITAGPCLAASYRFRNKLYVSVILRAAKVSGRFKQTRHLISITLQALYGSNLTQNEQNQLRKLYQRVDEDSEHSDEEQQFIYADDSNKQFQKRRNILNYEL